MGNIQYVVKAVFLITIECQRNLAAVKDLMRTKILNNKTQMPNQGCHLKISKS